MAIPRHPSSRHMALAASLALSVLTGCVSAPAPDAAARASYLETPAPRIERKELIVGVTDDNVLVTFNGSAPEQILSRQPLQGLAAGEALVGIDYRVARGLLYGLSTQGRLLRIDRTTGQATPVGEPVTMPAGAHVGFDFNPTVDRIRVVTDAGANLRLHPDTGAAVDGNPQQPGVQADGTLRYASGDLLEGRPARIVAVGYTYNADNDKITTNYAIDAQTRHLSIMGSLEGTRPEVSPNTGLMRSVGPLAIDGFDDAAFDIADTNNRAYLATRRGTDRATRLYEVDLKSGQARFIGGVGQGVVLRGLAIEP